MGAAAMTHELYNLTTLQELENESIFVMREVVGQCERPVMLYSIGKDSSVMLRLAQKAFSPAPVPFPLLHVDTTVKFPEMYDFRAAIVKEHELDLRVHINRKALADGASPWTWGSQRWTNTMKTQGLLAALREGQFDAAFGGARRDEERSRAKERFFSFRDRHGQWDPKRQRPEIWRLFNSRITPPESIRVFPLSNWTELDIWLYIRKESIPVVPLYFAADRPILERDGQWVPYYEGTPLLEGEKPVVKRCRYRTLGCHPFTCAVPSEAETVEDIIAELLVERQSERVTRLIDTDTEGSMEKKKQQGYF